MNASKSGCAKCKKKTLLNTECKCKKTFCLKCRAPEDHACSFDYQAEFQEKLKRDNPVIVGEKLEKV